MRVVVAGAGIGGLSAAIGLRKAGHDVVVLERAPRIEAAGAGITLFANAMNALERLDIAQAVADHGAPARRSAILTSRGRVLAELPADLLAGAVAVHRADLQSALAQAAGDVRLGVAVASTRQEGEEVVARTADGTEHRGDLLIGADGLHSVVRAGVAAASPRYAGYTSWRGVSPVTIEPGRFTESWGIGERFGLVDVGGGRTYWFATKNAAEREPDEPGGRKAEVTRRFSGWHAPIAAVVAAAPEDVILRNDVYFLDPLPRWSSGSIVLLGDAAHATTPGVGQGAAQAIEDAVVLAGCLASGRDLTGALRDYESVRRPRVKRVLKMSRRADRAAQLASPLGWRLRNAVARRTPARVQRRQLGPLVHHKL